MNITPFADIGGAARPRAAARRLAGAARARAPRAPRRAAAAPGPPHPLPDSYTPVPYTPTYNTTRSHTKHYSHRTSPNILTISEHIRTGPHKPRSLILIKIFDVKL